MEWCIPILKNSEPRTKKEVPLLNLPAYGLDLGAFNFGQKTTLAPLHKDVNKNRRDPKNKLSTLEWARKYRRIKGRPFTLDKHRPLIQIYDDDHPHVVIIKPAQVGISEFTLTKTMWALDIGAQFWDIPQEGINAAYLFPTEIALRDFSKERFGKLRLEDQFFDDFFAEYDDVTFKQAGDSVLYLRGASSPTQLLSFPADFLVLDEYDQMPSTSISLARQRMRASSVQHEIDISTPTLPGIGIDALYEQSDQHVWQIHCIECDTWIELDFFQDVRLNGEVFEAWSMWDEPPIRKATITMHCSNCQHTVDPFGEGRWFSRFPDREGLRGYHVPWYGFQSVSVKKLCLDAVSNDPTKRTELFRSGLGQPYTESGSRITEDMLSLLSQEIPHGIPKGLVWSKTTIGIDVGNVYHFRVSSMGSDGHRYVRAMGKTADLNGIDSIIRQYKVRRGVIDAQPERHGVIEWINRYKGRMTRAFYTHGPRQQKDAMIKYDPKKRTVTIHRTMAMDNVFATISEGKERWPKEIHSMREVVINMTAPVRIEKVDDTGQSIATWEHTKPDHGFHATTFDLCAGMIAPDTFAGGIGQGAARGWNPK